MTPSQLSRSFFLSLPPPTEPPFELRREPPGTSVGVLFSLTTTIPTSMWNPPAGILSALLDKMAKEPHKQ